MSDIGLSIRGSRSPYADQTLHAAVRRHHIGAMHLDLTEEETAALIKELHETVENDPYAFSPICTLRAILAKLRPEPVRKPLPPPKVYAAPRATAARRRRARG